MDEISKTLQAGDQNKLTALVEEKLEQGVAAVDILNKGLLEGMTQVGVQFKEEKIWLPEFLLAQRAMQAATNLLIPHLSETDVGTKGTVVIGTAFGDLHDIGKNIVKIMLEGHGYKVVDLGTDVKPESFVNTAIQESACAIAISALVTTTMCYMKDTVDLLKKTEGSENIKVLVGGAPVTQSFCDEIGADGYGASAPHGAELLDELMAAS